MCLNVFGEGINYISFIDYILMRYNAILVLNLSIYNLIYIKNIWLI